MYEAREANVALTVRGFCKKRLAGWGQPLTVYLSHCHLTKLRDWMSKGKYGLMIGYQ